MTKEMRPHRIDVLSDALFHYIRKSINRLGKNILLKSLET